MINNLDGPPLQGLGFWMSPLVAKLDGRYVLSDDLSEEDRGKPYTCDNCEKRLIVVIPIWKTKHFRHEQDDGCTCNTERETKEHILMKQNLMKILSQWNPEYEVELEKKVTVNAAPNGFRVADILLTSRTNNRKIVVESQASQISEDEVLKRTLDYMRTAVPFYGSCPPPFPLTETKVHVRRNFEFPILNLCFIECIFGGFTTSMSAHLGSTLPILEKRHERMSVLVTHIISRKPKL